MNFSYEELALLNQMISVALMSGKIEYERDLQDIKDGTDDGEVM